VAGCRDFGTYVDRRRAGEPRYSIGRPRDADVRIPDDLLTCPIFVGGRDSHGLHYRATGLLVMYPTPKGNDALALVTARHNVRGAMREYGNVWVRINTDSGGAVDMEVTSPWVMPDDEGSDVAAVPFWLPGPGMEPLPIPTRWIVDEALIEERKIGIGDELVVIGLFARHVGTARNLPIVRVGSIASMPHEPFEDPESGAEFHAYLAEVRSIGGLSGSPVFVALNPSGRWLPPPTDAPEDEHLPHPALDGQWFYLLGLVRGHWNTKETEDDYAESEFGRLNTGIALVTPMTELLPLLEEEAFVEHGKQMDEEFARQRGEGMVEDIAPADDGGDFERFDSLVGDLVNTPKLKPEDES
jgi:hypothetical protein